MKKGKINLLSFADDEGEEELEVQIKMKPSIKKEPEITRQPLDLSQIKDRVIHMKLDEEMVMEGEVAEALFDEEDEEEMTEVLQLQEQAQKQRINWREAINTSEELPDYVPISTKGDYWLIQDTKESEEAFNVNSRLVREDLFNEIEVDDASGAYTSFIGKSDGRQGLMMTKRMLERDIKTEIYDLELDPNVPDDDADSCDWEKGQVLKGIEKGWNRVDDETNFYSKQAKLPNYLPPPPIQVPKEKEKEVDFQNSLKESETVAIDDNVNKISEDSIKLEKRIKELELELESRSVKIAKMNEIETFFIRYSRFLSEKLPELKEIEESKDQSRWEHFFDNVDVEDNDLLNLPDIINKIKQLGLDTPGNLKESTELFVKYHFLVMEFNDVSNAKEIWENSGLAEALKSIENPVELMRNIFFNQPEKLKSIETEIFLQ